MSHETSQYVDLLEKLKNHEDGAVQEIVDRYGHHILRVVRRHLGRHMRIRFDSEDFVQAVWATLFVKSSAFQRIESEGQLIAFLTQIAFHKVIDARRANTRAQNRDLHRQVSIHEPSLSVHYAPASVTTPSEYLIADEELKKIQGELPASLQWMIDCRLRGMTFEAIAQQGGVHERTVRRVFERLRRRIADP